MQPSSRKCDRWWTRHDALKRNRVEKAHQKDRQNEREEGRDEKERKNTKACQQQVRRERQTSEAAPKGKLKKEKRKEGLEKGEMKRMLILVFVFQKVSLADKKKRKNCVCQDSMNDGSRRITWRQSQEEMENEGRKKKNDEEMKKGEVYQSTMNDGFLRIAWRQGHDIIISFLQTECKCRHPICGEILKQNLRKRKRRRERKKWKETDLCCTTSSSPSSRLRHQKEEREKESERRRSASSSWYRHLLFGDWAARGSQPSTMSGRMHEYVRDGKALWRVSPNEQIENDNRCHDDMNEWIPNGQQWMNE